MGDAWTPRHEVEDSEVRAYELRLLKPKSAKDDDAAAVCNKDDRKEVTETLCSRKSQGILAAVSPCLQILAARPMFASESLTQVTIFVWSLLLAFPQLEYVLYDNACGMVRHLKKVLREKKYATDCGANWERLALLAWVIDRLHFTYHKCWRDPKSPWFVEHVNPDDHQKLLGVDTEGAEQIFHIANRWQLILSNSSPVHQELFLLVFARAHNKNHSCVAAIEKYLNAQKRGYASARRDGKTRFCTSGSTCDSSCESCVPPKKIHRARKKVIPPDESLPSSNQVEQRPEAPDELVVNNADDPRQEPTSYAVLNGRSKTVHAVLHSFDVYSVCSWSFQNQAKTQVKETMRGKGYFLCGTCYGERKVFE